MLSFLNMYSGWGSIVLRVIIGIIFIQHGWPKVMNPARYAGVWGNIIFFGFLHGIVETLGGLALVIAYFVRPVALVFALIMLGAIYFKVFRWKSGFMSHTTTGWEFDLLLLAANLAILLG